MRVIAAPDGPVRCLAYSPDGSLLASGGDDGSVRLWRVGGSDKPAVVRKHGDWVRGLAFSKDGTRLASAGWEGVVIVGRASAQTAAQRTHEDHAGGAWSVAFSPDGHLLVVGAGDGTIHFYQGLDRPRRRKAKRHRQPVSCLAFTPDGRTLASGSHDGTVRLWDADWVKERSTLEGHADWIRCLAVSPDGKRLASCSDDGLVLLWSLPDGGESGGFEAHDGPIGGASFAPDGRRLITVGWDGTARVFDVEGVRTTENARLTSAYQWDAGKLLCGAVSPDGMTAAGGTQNGGVIVWDLE
jgi:WD40 repeat protein